MRQWDEQKGQNANLRKKMWTLVGVSSAVIALLAGSTFGATFVAVHASKDTKVASSGGEISYLSVAPWPVSRADTAHPFLLSSRHAQL